MIEDSDFYRIIKRYCSEISTVQQVLGHDKLFPYYIHAFKYEHDSNGLSITYLRELSKRDKRLSYEDYDITQFNIFIMNQKYFDEPVFLAESLNIRTKESNFVSLEEIVKELRNNIISKINKVKLVENIVLASKEDNEKKEKLISLFALPEINVEKLLAIV